MHMGDVGKGVWGTDVEITAIARMTGLDVVMFVHGSWMVTNARSKSQPTREAFFLDNIYNNHYSVTIF